MFDNLSDRPQRIFKNLRGEGRSPAVAGLAVAAIDVVESHLLEEILKKPDVKGREQWHLALALFSEFDASSNIDDKLDPEAVLIAGLGSKVILTDD